jgi:hypothetical protein
MGKTSLTQTGVQEPQIFGDWKLRHHVVGNLDSAQQAPTLAGGNRLHLDSPHHLVYAKNLELLA